MYLLMPTCPAYEPIAKISCALLKKYWPNHPELHVAVDASDDGWLANTTRAVRAHDEEWFVLLLDDYGLCAAPDFSQIAIARQMLQTDTSACMYALCWHPAQARSPYAGSRETVELRGAPLLLQGAIWRRSFFLELAEQMDGRTSAWGFEIRATQLLKRDPRPRLAANMPEPTWIGGAIPDGYDKSHWPLPYHNLMHRGQPALQYESFLHSLGLRFPSRGLGDTLARITHATGIDRLVHRDCGCAKRREQLNRMMGYR